MEQEGAVMKAKPGFRGFPREAVQFYSELGKNNNKAWFDEHKSDFNQYVMAPAQDFVFEMGELLKGISPGIIADPRVNKSIFRPYRDTRFSHDKTPYKTHLGIFFWEGKLAKMDCPGYYFHLEPPTFFLAAGMHCFSKRVLETYRDAVVDDELGKKLRKAISAVTKEPGCVVGGKHFKKTPRGYDPGHENAEMLLYNGLYVMTESDIPEELYSAKLLDYCLKRFKDLRPIHQWLVTMIERVGQ